MVLPSIRRSCERSARKAEESVTSVSCAQGGEVAMNFSKEPFHNHAQNAQPCVEARLSLAGVLQYFENKTSRITECDFCGFPRPTLHSFILSAVFKILWPSKEVRSSVLSVHDCGTAWLKKFRGLTFLHIITN